jgi:hypothetical protein
LKVNSAKINLVHPFGAVNITLSSDEGKWIRPHRCFFKSSHKLINFADLLVGRPTHSCPGDFTFSVTDSKAMTQVNYDPGKLLFKIMPSLDPGPMAVPISKSQWSPYHL